MNALSGSRILEYVLAGPWALEPTVHAKLVQLVARHAQGNKLAEAEVEAITAARDEKAERKLPSRYENRGGFGVIPITGVIARHSRQVNGMSQPRGTSCEQIRNDVEAGLADADAHTLVLAIDSPGGSVDGLVELADELRAARERKAIVAHATGMMCSAAYWLGSQAHQIHATRATVVGSIGVIATVVDDHRWFEEQGVDVRYITSAEPKTAGAPGKQHSLRDLAEIDAEVRSWHELFVDAVAAGRGVDRKRAAAWGDGRVHFAEEARQLGLIDGVSTESELFARLQPKSKRVVAQSVGATQDVEDDTMVKQDGATPAVADKPAATTAPASNVATNPALAPAAQATAPSPAPAANTEDLVARARAEERARIAEIQKLGAGVDPKLVAQAIEDGSSPERAAVRFLGYMQERNAGRLAGMREELSAEKRAAGTDDDQVHVEGSKPKVETPVAAPTAEEQEKAWRAEFAKDPALRSEFITEDGYVAYRRHVREPAKR